jgi:hypothetical protein
MEGNASHEKPSTRAGGKSSDDFVGLSLLFAGGLSSLRTSDGWKSSRLSGLSLLLRGWGWAEGPAGRLLLFACSSWSRDRRRGMKASSLFSLSIVFLPPHRFSGFNNLGGREWQKAVNVLHSAHNPRSGQFRAFGSPRILCGTIVETSEGNDPSCLIRIAYSFCETTQLY